MRIKLVIITSLLFLVSAHGQKVDSAKLLLDQTTSLLEGGKGVQVDFYTEFTQGAEEGEMEGSIWMMGDQFVIKTEEMKTWFDGLTQWSLIFNMEEVNIIEPTEQELLDLNPYWILKTYKKGYSIKEGKVDKGLQEVVLTAQKKSMDLQTINIWIDLAERIPKIIYLTRKDGSFNTVKIKGIKQNIPLDKNFFKFNPNAYPRVEEVDLR